MTQELINQYKINFKNIARHNPVLGTKKNIKSPDVENLQLFYFLDDWVDTTELDSDLLPNIDVALGNSTSELEYGTQTTMILIQQNDVDFYDIHGDYDSSIPTLDFKEIVIGWRDFLLTPPLNDTII